MTCSLTLSPPRCALLLPCSSQSSPPQSELFLRSGASFATLASTLDLGPGSLLGFSFRTCQASGELLRQIGSSSDSVSLSLSSSGGLLLRLQRGEESREASVGEGLADGAWHTVRLGVAVGRSALCLSVDAAPGSREAECLPPASGPSLVAPATLVPSPLMRLEGVEALLSGLNLTGGPLRVGGGVVACLREGPGLLTSTGEVTDQAGVAWGPCLLPHTCDGE